MKFKPVGTNTSPITHATQLQQNMKTDNNMQRRTSPRVSYSMNECAKPTGGLVRRTSISCGTNEDSGGGSSGM